MLNTRTPLSKLEKKLLEKKLKELGYEEADYLQGYLKSIYYGLVLVIYIIDENTRENKIHGCVKTNGSFSYQRQINTVQEAFNTLQKDVEVLKKCLN